MAEFVAHRNSPGIAARARMTTPLSRAQEPGTVSADMESVRPPGRQRESHRMSYVLTPEHERSIPGQAFSQLASVVPGMGYQQRSNATRMLVVCLNEYGYTIVPWVPMNQARKSLAFCFESMAQHGAYLTSTALTRLARGVTRAGFRGGRDSNRWDTTGPSRPAGGYWDRVRKRLQGPWRAIHSHRPAP
jgi:hypothetical protein